MPTTATATLDVDLTQLEPQERRVALRLMTRRLVLRQRARSSRGLSRAEQMERTDIERELAARYGTRFSR